jgi:hypothetical protein
MHRFSHYQQKLPRLINFQFARSLAAAKIHNHFCNEIHKPKTARIFAENWI